MIDLLLDLLRHKAHANASLLGAIRECEAAAIDKQLHSLLHHIIVANRFWLMSARGLSFDVERELLVPATLDEIEQLYRETHDAELEWATRLQPESLNRAIEGELVPGGKCTLGEALMQVCLHSHGHRAQCATMLRALGGTPPAMDFIVWLVDRPGTRTSRPS